MKINIQKLSKYIAVISAITILFCSISFPAFADYTDPVNLENNTDANTAYRCSFATGQNLGVWRDNDSTLYVVGVSYYGTNQIFFASESKAQWHVGLYNNDNYSAGSGNTLSAYDNTYQLYYYRFTQWSLPSDSSNVYLPIYNVDSNYNAPLSAIRDYIDNPPSSSVSAEFNYTVPAGYALYVDIHGLTGVSGSVYTNTSAAYASPHTSNQTLSYQSSLPSSGANPAGNGINWQGTGNKDLFGRYKSWYCNLIIQPGSKFIAIYNPVHIDSYVDPEHEDFNGSIAVHVSEAFAESSVLIPLNTELNGTGQIGTITTDDSKPLNYDPDTGTWYPTNSDGSGYTPSPYGDYMPSTVNSVQDWLQNIANSISGFFNGAIGAVTTLVNAGSAFITSLVSLYSWLPGSVYAVLSSALILVITIGVIKVFI